MQTQLDSLTIGLLHVLNAVVCDGAGSEYDRRSLVIVQ